MSFIDRHRDNQKQIFLSSICESVRKKLGKVFLNSIDKHFSNNIFEFSDKTYEQICETAIGTKFTPPYAILLMAALKENILDKVNPLSSNPTYWSNTLKQFFDKLPTNCLSVFDHFAGLALKGLKRNRVFGEDVFFICSIVKNR